MSLELTVRNSLDFMLRPMLIQVVLYLGSLWTLQVLLAPVIRRVFTQEIPLTMGMTDRIHPWLTTRVASVFLILSSSWTRSTIISATSIFQIERSPTVSIFKGVLAHLCCQLLFFGPRAAVSSGSAAQSRSCTCVSMAMFVSAGRASHALSLWCMSIAAVLDRWLFLLLLTWHGRFASISFTLTEEKVLVLVSLDAELQIYYMTHVFIIFNCTLDSLFVTFAVFLLLLFLFVLVIEWLLLRRWRVLLFFSGLVILRLEVALHVPFLELIDSVCSSTVVIVPIRLTDCLHGQFV